MSRSRSRMRQGETGRSSARGLREYTDPSRLDQCRDEGAGLGHQFCHPPGIQANGSGSRFLRSWFGLLARALLVHTAVHPDGQPDPLLGHGCIVESIDDVLLCEEHTVTVVFQGDILPSRIVQLPIPWPSTVTIPGKVQITWTVAALAPVDPLHPGDYTCCCLEETFYPQANRYEFRPPKDAQGKPRRLDMEIDAEVINGLLASGWKKAEWPLSESGNEYRDEEQRRKLDCKWESIVRRTKSKFANKILSPFMTLHAIGRNGAGGRFDYAVVVTLRADRFGGDLYSEIRTQYPALAPIRLRTEAETRIQI